MSGHKNGNLWRSLWTLYSWLDLLRDLLPFTRPHRRLFALGSLAALGVVVIRLAIPRIFHVVLRPWLKLPGPGSVAISADTSYWALVGGVGVVVCLMLAALGFADYWERLQFARFAIATVRDLRTEAHRGILQVRLSTGGDRSGDLVARLVSDTARMKAGLKGFLVHVMTNGALYLGATAILLTVNVYLGLLLAISGLATGVVTVCGAVAVFHRTFKYRRREGQLALAIERQMTDDEAVGSFEEHNLSSSRVEALITRVQGLTTWAAHAIYGLTISLALVAGSWGIAEGKLSVSDFAMFLLYALTLRGPTVQLARQGSRTGKILACFTRIHEIMILSGESTDSKELFPLVGPVKLRNVRVKTSTGHSRRSRIKKIDLTLLPGDHILLVGGLSAGKTTLLKVISGELWPSKGEISWNGVTGSEQARVGLAKHVFYCPGGNVVWRRQSLGTWLGISEHPPDQEVVRVLKLCGTWKTVQKLRDGLSTKVSSAHFSNSERSSLALAKAILGAHPILLLDNPLGHLSRREAAKLLKSIFKLKPLTTIVYACRKPIAQRHFDRVVHLSRGQVVLEDSNRDVPTGTDPVRSQ